MQARIIDLLSQISIDDITGKEKKTISIGNHWSFLI
jgi:hypothetical protein